MHTLTITMFNIIGFFQTKAGIKFEIKLCYHHQRIRWQVGFANISITIQNKQLLIYRSRISASTYVSTIKYSGLIITYKNKKIKKYCNDNAHRHTWDMWFSTQFMAPWQYPQNKLPETHIMHIFIITSLFSNVSLTLSLPPLSSIIHVSSIPTHSVLVRQWYASVSSLILQNRRIWVRTD